MKKTTKYSPEVRERSVRMVFEQRSEHPLQWAAIQSIPSNDLLHPQTLHEHRIDILLRNGDSVLGQNSDAMGKPKRTHRLKRGGKQSKIQLAQL